MLEETAQILSRGPGTGGLSRVRKDQPRLPGSRLWCLRRTLTFGTLLFCACPLGDLACVPSTPSCTLQAPFMAAHAAQVPLSTRVLATLQAVPLLVMGSMVASPLPGKLLV